MQFSNHEGELNLNQEEEEESEYFNSSQFSSKPNTLHFQKFQMSNGHDFHSPDNTFHILRDQTNQNSIDLISQQEINSYEHNNSNGVVPAPQRQASKTGGGKMIYEYRQSKEGSNYTKSANSGFVPVAQKNSHQKSSEHKEHSFLNKHLQPQGLDISLFSSF